MGGTITHQYNTAHTKHRTECASPQEASAIKPPGKPALRQDLSLIAPHVCEREGFLRQPSGDCLPIAQQMGDCLSFSTEVVLPLFSSLGGAVPAGVTRFPCARPRVEKSRGVVPKYLRRVHHCTSLFLWEVVRCPPAPALCWAMTPQGCGGCCPCSSMWRSPGALVTTRMIM